MSCYEALASSYDALTEDVGYEKRGGLGRVHLVGGGLF